MATAKRLPSGSWRVQAFSHYEIKDGKKKRKYESFTSDDKTRQGKYEAERMEMEWRMARQNRLRSVSLIDAVSSYIDAKKPLLSPPSVRAYTSYKKHHMDEIGLMDVHHLDMTLLQQWVSGLCVSLSPKTVKEIVMLVSSAYHLATGKRLNFTLPQPSPKEQHTPVDAEVKAILNHVRGTDLEIAIMLAAFCSLRRAEICALTDKDFSGGMVSVNKAMVRDVTGDWIIKSPKTPGSIRSVPVPQGILDTIGDRKGRIVSFNPDALTKAFIKAVKKAGLPPFRFHDLRHYYASTAHYLGVPDAYIMANGGWATDSVMKRVYREALEDKKREENEKMDAHFKKVL